MGYLRDHTEEWENLQPGAFFKCIFSLLLGRNHAVLQNGRGRMRQVGRKGSISGARRQDGEQMGKAVPDTQEATGEFSEDQAVGESQKLREPKVKCGPQFLLSSSSHIAFHEHPNVYSQVSTIANPAFCLGNNLTHSIYNRPSVGKGL